MNEEFMGKSFPPGMSVHERESRKKKMGISLRKPPWLRRSLPKGPVYGHVQHLLREAALHTVCEAAHCPNQFECFGRRTATFLLLGDICTRNCRFCNIETGRLLPPDENEPQRVAEAVSRLGLSYVVLTSVTRDDLSDGGAGHFYKTIRVLREKLPEVGIEVLIPDFQGCAQALNRVLEAGPDVLNHNMETVSRLYPAVRPQARYTRSLELLERVASHPSGIPAKSGLMLGLGEEEDEILETLEDLRTAGCTRLTLGQYLQPSAAHLAVERFVTPGEFDAWKEKALAMGFTAVASGPFVRSSYRAEEDRPGQGQNG